MIKWAYKNTNIKKHYIIQIMHDNINETNRE